MTNFLIEYYLWIKVSHIIFIITWMAGLFYLPRLFVYHTEHFQIKSSTYDIFLGMEYKLLYFIMRPAMIGSWFFGFFLAITPGIIDWSLYWPWIKLFSILLITLYHFWLASFYKNFSNYKNKYTGKFFRIINEIPTILMIIIIIFVVIKPF